MLTLEINVAERLARSLNLLAAGEVANAAEQLHTALDLAEALPVDVSIRAHQLAEAIGLVGIAAEDAQLAATIGLVRT